MIEHRALVGTKTMTLDELQATVAGCASKLREAARHADNRKELVEASRTYAKTLNELQTSCAHADMTTEVIETSRFPFIAVPRSRLFCGKEIP